MNLNSKNFIEPANLSDVDLLELCRDYGARALEWRRRFIGLLPEVNKRQLYLKKGCASIFEFAAKLCGLSEDQVSRTLSLEKKFQEMPTLMKMLVNGEESINKLAKVASIATPENEAELAEQIKKLPVRAVETLVRDEFVHVNRLERQNAPVASAEVKNGLQLSDEVQTKLLELQEKGIDINSMILEMLAVREARIHEEKAVISENIQPAPSRYIPARIKRILKQEHGEKCSIATCKKPSQEIHHTQRFALGKNHDPHYLAPLCKEHHVIAHSIDAKVLKARAFIT